MRLSPDTIDKFFDGDSVRPGFSGIGPFRGKTDYTDDERTVAGYFFTNTDSNVTCATNNLPNQMWGLFMGQYARSNLPSRDRLLNLFKNMNKSDSSIISVPELADLIREKQKEDISEQIKIVGRKYTDNYLDSGENFYLEAVVDLKGIENQVARLRNINNEMAVHLKKSGDWIEFNGQTYGHASLRDSDIIRIAFEGVSQRATKFLESAREGAYQEQSTRALPFNIDYLGVPLEIRGTRIEEDLRVLCHNLVGTYEKAMEKLVPHLNEKFGDLRKEADERIAKETGTDRKFPDKLWDKTVREKAFDVARYLIPNCMTTSVGITLNTRRFQSQLSQWQSLPHQEMQLLGRAAQIESMKISPNLMKYGNASEFYINVHEKRRELYDQALKDSGVELKELEFKHYDGQTTLIATTPNLEDNILAGILFHSGDNRYSFHDLTKVVKELSAEKRKNLAHSFMKGIGKHDDYPKDFEVGSMIFERFYDIGAYRDLQRQRGDRQLVAPYNVIGYNMPPEFKEIGMEDEFIQRMNEVKSLYDVTYKMFSPFVAEYVTTMANVIRHVTTKDFTQLLYEAPLRTQPAGIDSYRKIMQKEVKLALKELPAFEGLPRADNKYYPLSRLPEGTDGVIAKIKREDSSTS